MLLASAISLAGCYKKFDPASYAPPLRIGGYTSASEIAPGNLVAYWSFDGSSIDSVSKTTGDNKGVTFTDGIKGKCLQGASKSYMLFNPGASILNLQKFTVTMWVKSPQNTDGIVGLIGLSNTQSFWGNLDVFFENGSTETTGKLKVHVSGANQEAWLGNYDLQNPWNSWTHIALSYNGADTFRIYVNGARIDSKAVTGYGPAKFVNPGKMVFGTMQFQTTPSLTSATSAQPWASYLTGNLDEVRIYNTVINDDDISSLSKLEARGK